MNIHYGQAAIAIFILLVAVARYWAFRKRLGAGQSRTEALIEQAGGLENLLRNARRVRLGAYALLLLPFIECFAFARSPHLFSVFVMTSLVVAPGVVILFYFSWNAKRVAADGLRIREGRHEPTMRNEN